MTSLFESQNEQETAQFAGTLARQAKAGDVFFLDAPMGAGKSAFARGFVQALCGQDTDVPSPTFTLVQTYDAPAAPLYHFDLYRLEYPEEVFNLGWDDAIAPDTIVLIEWPEKAGPYLPPKATQIRITITGPTTRRIEVIRP